MKLWKGLGILGVSVGALGLLLAPDAERAVRVAAVEALAGDTGPESIAAPLNRPLAGAGRAPAAYFARGRPNALDSG